MKLWGGRFTKETDQLVQNFNESLSFDQKFLPSGYQRKHCSCKDAGKAGNPF